jgi:hypothetical protein
MSIFPASNEVWTLQKSTNNREGSQYRSYDAASGSMLRVRRKVFIEAS